MAVSPEPDCVVINLTGLSTVARHGALDHEHVIPQPFVVDLSLLVPEFGDDDLSHTVDYSQAARAALEVLSAEPMNLIETIASRIASACLRIEPVRAVEVCVHKPHAPIAHTFGDVSATVYRKAS
ncbi:dihydroneopterin aldolase [Propionibacterium sp.]|uniref:dihydroneopterin aldolase n=1 Tax=Propionibacterium sp. TaxID=1977903 RepID=UPI0039ED0D97